MGCHKLLAGRVHTGCHSRVHAAPRTPSQPRCSGTPVGPATHRWLVFSTRRVKRSPPNSGSAGTVGGVKGGATSEMSHLRWRKQGMEREQCQGMVQEHCSV